MRSALWMSLGCSVVWWTWQGPGPRASSDVFPLAVAHAFSWSWSSVSFSLKVAAPAAACGGPPAPMDKKLSMAPEARRMRFNRAVKSKRNMPTEIAARVATRCPTALAALFQDQRAISGGAGFGFCSQYVHNMYACAIYRSGISYIHLKPISPT